MKIPKFILDRTDDYLHHSKLWIIGYAVLFYLCSALFFSLLQMACMSIYDSVGINPETMTSFGGDPTHLKQYSSNLYFLLSTLVIAPLCEELIFRLGLSSKRKTIALWIGILPVVLVWYFISKCPLINILLLEFGALAAMSLYFFTDDDMLQNINQKHFKLYVWTSALLFGFLHLTAFSELSFKILPFALCISVWPFLGGCVITYIRVNIGFIAGVVTHIMVNLPAVIATMVFSI